MKINDELGFEAVFELLKLWSFGLNVSQSDRRSISYNKNILIYMFFLSILLTSISLFSLFSLLSIAAFLILTID